MVNFLIAAFILLTNSFNAVAAPAAVLAPQNSIQVCAIVVADIIVGSPSVQGEFPVDPVKGATAIQKLAVRVVGAIIILSLVGVLAGHILNPPIRWMAVLFEGVGILFLGAIIVKIDAVVTWFNALF